jgi:hypothetical protein
VDGFPRSVRLHPLSPNYQFPFFKCATLLGKLFSLRHRGRFHLSTLIYAALLQLNSVCERGSQSSSEVISYSQVSRLANGVTVVSQDNCESVSHVSVYVAAGSRNETAQTAGTAHFLKSLPFQVYLCLPNSNMLEHHQPHQRFHCTPSGVARIQVLVLCQPGKAWIPRAVSPWKPL